MVNFAFLKKNATVVAFLVLGLCDVFQSHRERFLRLQILCIQP